MDPIGTAGAGGITAATPLRVFLSHTSDLGKHTEPGSFVAAAVLRARHAVTDMAYFAARDTSPAAYSGAPCAECGRGYPLGSHRPFPGSGSLADGPPAAGPQAPCRLGSRRGGWNGQIRCRWDRREEMADQIGRYQERAFPLIKRSVGDVFVFSRSKYYILGLLEVDVTGARELIHRHEAETGDTLSFTAWVAKCLAQAISEHPAANSFRKGSRRVVTFEDVDVLVVVEKHVGAGRFPVPYVIRKANEKTVQAIHDEIRRAQAGGFQDEETAIREEASRDTQNILLRLANPFRLPRFVRRLYWRSFRTDPLKVKRVMGTAGITAVGMFGHGGGWAVAPGTHTIDLGVGGITRKPGVVGDRIAIREVLDLSVQVDHEMVDGAPAARFAARLTELMTSAFALDGSYPSEHTGTD